MCLSSSSHVFTFRVISVLALIVCSISIVFELVSHYFLLCVLMFIICHIFIFFLLSIVFYLFFYAMPQARAAHCRRRSQSMAKWRLRPSQGRRPWVPRVPAPMALGSPGCPDVRPSLSPQRHLAMAWRRPHQRAALACAIASKTIQAQTKNIKTQQQYKTITQLTNNLHYLQQI
jgi:hypothetical protein